MTIYGPLEHMGVPVFIQAVTLGAVILMGTGLVLKRQIAGAAQAGVLPDEGVTLRNVLELIVGGIAPCVMARTEITASTPPAPPIRCPIIDLVEETATRFAASPKVVLIAKVSILSFNSVEVPWALM